MTRDEFMDIVYSELHSDGDNYRANRIIDAADEYAEDSSEKPNEQIPVMLYPQVEGITPTVVEPSYNSIKTELSSSENPNKSEIPTGWIPVSERLPEKGKQVLCCNKSGSVFTSAITYINSNGMVAFGQHYEVIAWMPLPEPYKASPTGEEVE